MTLHNVITHITSVLNKDKNHYYYQIFSENGHINYLKNNYKHFVCSMLMVKVGKTEVAKETFYAAKKPIKSWDDNFDNIVISKLVQTKINSNYLIGYVNKAIRPLVLIIPKTSGYVKTFKVEDKDNKSMSFRIDNEKLLQKYKAIWT